MERPLKAYSFVGNRWLMKEEEAVVEVEAVAVDVAVAHRWPTATTTACDNGGAHVDANSIDANYDGSPGSPARHRTTTGPGSR